MSTCKISPSPKKLRFCLLSNGEPLFDGRFDLKIHATDSAAERGRWGRETSEGEREPEDLIAMLETRNDELAEREAAMLVRYVLRV